MEKVVWSSTETVGMTLVRVAGKKKGKLQNQRVTVCSRWWRSRVQMNHGLYFTQDVSSDKSVVGWQNISPTNAQTMSSQAKMRSTTGSVFCGEVMFPSMRGAMDAACVRANDNCSTLLLTPNPKRTRISQSKMWWRKERERGSMCPMTACGARQMSMFSRQLFKAMQWGSGWWIVMFSSVWVSPA